MSHISESCVQKIIGESKAPNCQTDPIPSKFIKIFKLYITPVMTTLINLSLNTGTFVKDWKTSTITLFIKKSNLIKEFKNYQLVNNFFIIYKYVEKAMLVQLNRYMTTHNLSDYLSAYRKNFSMETILVKTHHDILKAFEEQKGVLLTGLNLSAAFDTVDHTILITVLENKYGISGLALE